MLEPGTVYIAPGGADRGRLARLGFRSAGPQMIRADMAERIARHAHEVRAGKEGAIVDDALVTSLGLQPEAVAKLMADIGFRPSEGEAGWAWKGRERRRRERPGERRSHAFAALAGLKRG